MIHMESLPLIPPKFPKNRNERIENGFGIAICIHLPSKYVIPLHIEKAYFVNEISFVNCSFDSFPENFINHH